MLRTPVFSPTVGRPLVIGGPGLTPPKFFPAGEPLREVCCAKIPQHAREQCPVTEYSVDSTAASA